MNPICVFSRSAVFLLGAALAAQTPAPPKPVDPGRTVLLTATVRDKHGAPVKDLKANELTLTMDGRPQTILSLAPQSSQPTRLGLLVDTGSAMTHALESERKAATKFVDLLLPEDAAQTRDQIFLIHFDREVELLEDFTSARAKLTRELDTMEQTRPSRSTHEANRDADNDRGNHGDSERGGPPSGGPGGGKGPGASGSSSQLYDAIFLASDELMKSQSGRKALVVFSNGVDRSSKETLNDAIDAADRAGLAIYAIYFKGEEEKSGSKHSIPGLGGGQGGGRSGIPGIGGNWPTGGGSGSPSGGGRGGGSDKDVKIDGKKILEKIATRTGGRCFEAKKTENLEEVYKQIADELRAQFLVSFAPDRDDRDGQFHKIALKAVKDGLTVETREGYYAAEEK